jgi:curli production assembly/transport component CsgG/holdfast attachment protein HfaB
LGANFFDASVGQSALEPIQLAVRSVIERAVLEMITRLYHIPGNVCTSPIGTKADPLADPSDRNPYRYYSRPHNGPITQETAYEENRQRPYHGYSSSDPVGDLRLRGGIN